MYSRMQRLVEWAEVEISRGRKIVLFSIIFSFVILTFLIFIASLAGLPMEEFKWYYGTFALIVGSAIGFYTGTSPKNLDKVIDKIDKSEK